MRKQLEHNEQSALFGWAELQKSVYPELELMFAIPNGAFYGRDKRSAFAQHNHLRSEGLKKGVPDIFLAYPSKGYHGLFIEMKSAKGKLSPEQETWQILLSNHGYLCEVCRSFEDAKKIILKYLD